MRGMTLGISLIWGIKFLTFVIHVTICLLIFHTEMRLVGILEVLRCCIFNVSSICINCWKIMRNIMKWEVVEFIFVVHGHTPLLSGRSVMMVDRLRFLPVVFRFTAVVINMFLVLGLSFQDTLTINVWFLFSKVIIFIKGN